MTTFGNGEDTRGPDAADDAGGAAGRRVDAAPDSRYLYSPDEAARRLGISRTRVYQLLRAQWLTGLKIGRRTLIADKQIRELIDRMLADPGLLSRI